MKVDPSDVRLDATVNTVFFFGKAKHSPTNDLDTNAVWMDVCTEGGFATHH